MNIGERIKARRLELCMTLEDIGVALGVNRSTVKRYENGETERIPPKTIEKLAIILKTTPENLMGWDAPSNKDSLQLDGEILVLAREMQKLPDDKINLLKTIVKAMSDISDMEMKQ
jgi:transcriptional regulator with XRE-family HTH domain